jgi:hypothetical protein
MDEPEKAELDLAAAHLAEELSECHAVVMAAFKFAAAHPNPDVQLNAMQAATRMMQANAAAASALKRLKEEGGRHTFTYVHEGAPPTPKKSKTNVPAEEADEPAQHGG